MGSIVLGSLVVLAGAAVAGHWRGSGELGIEFDGLGEAFGLGTIFDTRINDQGTLEETIEVLRFKDTTTQTSGLLRYRLDHYGAANLQFRSTLKANSERTYLNLDGDLRLPSSFGEWILGDRLHAQGGSGDRGGGVLNVARAGLRIRPDGSPLSIRCLASHEVSRAGEDSLTALFDYTIFRPSVQLRYDPGFVGSLSLEGAAARKRMLGAGSGAYDGLWLDGRFSRYFGPRGYVDLEARIEGRHYVESDSLTPSYNHNQFLGRVEAPLFHPFDIELTAFLREFQYSIDSSVFEDHRVFAVESTLEFEPKWRRGGNQRSTPDRISENETPPGSPEPVNEIDGTAELHDIELIEIPDSDQGILEWLGLDDLGGFDSSRPDSGSVGSDPVDSPPRSPETVGDTQPQTAAMTSLTDWPSRWRLGIGGRAEWLRKELRLGSDYGELAAVLTVARESTEGFWIDGRFEFGRRDYGVSSQEQDISFEGLNLTLSGTDYRFVGVSLLSQVPVGRAFRFGLFGQLDKEFHTASADDFTLWIASISIVREF